MPPTGEIAVLISAITASIAVIVSIVIHIQTRSLTRRTEKPIFSISKPKVQFINADDDCAHIDFIFPFTNIGKSPASDICISLGSCSKEIPQTFKASSYVSMVNRIDPGGAPILFQKDLFLEKNLNARLQAGKTKILFYVLLTYKDIYNPKKNYCDEFFLEYIYGTSTIDHARMEDSLVLRPYIKKIYGKDIYFKKRHAMSFFIKLWNRLLQIFPKCLSIPNRMKKTKDK